jgi:hypothetical protein
MSLRKPYPHRHCQRRNDQVHSENCQPDPFGIKYFYDFLDFSSQILYFLVLNLGKGT